MSNVDKVVAELYKGRQPLSEPRVRGCQDATERLTLKECQEKFGKAEFLETAHGYAPHIVANQV